MSGKLDGHSYPGTPKNFQTTHIGYRAHRAVIFAIAWHLVCKEDGSKKELTVVGTDTIKTIIESSKWRFDDLHEDLETRLLADKHLEVLCHRDCVSTYTSKSHINRHLNKLSASKGSAETSEKQNVSVGPDRQHSTSGNIAFSVVKNVLTLILSIRIVGGGLLFAGQPTVVKGARLLKKHF